MKSTAPRLAVKEEPRGFGWIDALVLLALMGLLWSALHFDKGMLGHFNPANEPPLAEGATLVVSEQARPWFERGLAQPNSINLDSLAKSNATVSLVEVNGRRTFSDGSRTVEILMVENSVHAQGFMMVWLPRERILVEADAYTPGPPGTPAPAQPNANNVNLAQNIERLGLDVDRILPLHGRMVPVGELYTAVGRKS